MITFLLYFKRLSCKNTEKKNKEKCHLCSNVALSLYNIVTICIEKKEPLFETVSKLKRLFTCRQLEMQDNMFQDYYSKEREKSKLESSMKCRIIYYNNQKCLVVKREMSFMHKEREKSKARDINEMQNNFY